MNVLTAAIFVLIPFISHVYCQKQCVTRGECGEDEITVLNRPCAYDGPPVKLEDSSAAEILQTLCPTLETGPDSKVCCDANQIVSLQTNLDAMATLFKRCPSCFHNLANVFCQLVCSPEQSQFLEVIESTKFEDKESVTDMNYYITEHYAQGLFNSCNNVKLSFTSYNAIDIACGGYSTDCTPHLWLNYIGGHDPSPYQLNFQYELKNTVTINGTKFTPMNQTIVPCSEAVSPDGKACSRIDCPI